MATARKQGKGYQITASAGYDLNGNQIREYMTWIPTPGMTERQIKKELDRQKDSFDALVQGKGGIDRNIRLANFTEIFMSDYVEPNWKIQTIYNYQQRINIINKALGHIKLSELNPRQISAFYRNLQEKGTRVREVAICKIDLKQWIKDHHTSVVELSDKSGQSKWAFNRSKTKKPIAVESAKTIAETIGMEFKQMYTVQKDMRPLSKESILTYKRMLHTILNLAVKWGYLDENPADRVDILRAKGKGSYKVKYLEIEDARKLLELLQDEPIKWRTFFTFDLLSGFRRGEIAGLYWDDIDPKKQTVEIKRTLNYVPGAGIYEDVPKTDESERVFRLTESAFVMLGDYKAWQAEQKEKLGDLWQNTEGRIFTSDTGGPIFPGSATQWFSKFVKRSGLPPITVHALRHTYATLMIDDGVPLVVVSRQLGHAQVSTTANIYAHALQAAEARAAETFSKFDEVVIAKKNKR